MTSWFEDGASIATIAVDDRSAQYGDGVFETVAVRHGAPRLWAYHVERLQLGCERLGIPAPSDASLTSGIDAAIAATDIDTSYATAKLIVAAGPGERGYRRPATQPVTRIGIFAAAPRPAAAYKQGVRVRLCNTRLAIQPQLAGVKSLNRLEQVMARAEWNDADVFEGLTLDTGGRLICGTMSNVFAYLDNKLVTPALTRCGVAGVMRRHVLTELDEQGYPAEVRDISLQDLADTDEVFLTNSQFGVLPVTRLDDRSLGIGDATARVMELVAASGVEEWSG